jgi:thermitase
MRKDGLMTSVRVNGNKKISEYGCIFLLSIILCLNPCFGTASGSDKKESPQRERKSFAFSQAEKGRSSAHQFKAGEILVKFKSAASNFSIENSLRRHKAKIRRRLHRRNTMVWATANGREKEIVDRLNADPSVDYAEPNYIYRAFNTPNDPNFNKQWGHTTINSASGWDITEGSASTVIAIIDSGIDENHPDLKDKIVAGYDFVDNDTVPHDLHGHGTHVAGIAAAITDNGMGVAGMDWNARIMPIRVLDEYGSGYSSDISDGITWACSNGAKVLNLSLGGPHYSQIMQDTINSARDAGCLVIAAMGNSRTDGNPTNYPAGYANVFTVAATNSTDTYTYYSQYGTHCDISAPGGEMDAYHDPGGFYSTMPTYSVHLTSIYDYDQNYDYLQGTSQATPMVSGLAALIWAVNPNLTSDLVQATIEKTAVDLGAPGKDDNYGYGRIDVQAALNRINPPPKPSPPASVTKSAFLPAIYFLLLDK